MEDIKDYLEIVLITYNRATELKNTLDALCKSPFAVCRITILNNASTDNTLKVCNSYLDEFANLTIITHKVNIGGNANILRAVETSNGKYTWILADDDEYDFSDCDDLIEAIITEKAELIHVGAHTDVPWNLGGNLDTPRNLVNKGYPFFRFSSFLPCNVFRTEAFYPYIIQGYDNIINFYPHMPFLISFYELDKYIYITKNRIVKAVIIRYLSYHKNILREINVGWFNTVLLLKNKKERKMVFKEQLGNSITKKMYLPLHVLLTIILYRIPITKYYQLFGITIFLCSLVLFPVFCIYFVARKVFRSFN